VTESELVSPASNRAQPAVGASGEADLRHAQAELAVLRRRLGALEGQIGHLTRALETAEQELAALPPLRDELEATRDSAHWLEMTQASLSWRVTRPLRWLARAARRPPTAP
jgi:septal ring factor EnvC (AmiA/AmiB activator)